jgi:ribonucleoside-diphosphate reductase alpha chain
MTIHVKPDDLVRSAPAISQQIWDSKYRFRRSDGTAEANVEETWSRIAKALAQPEKDVDRRSWEKKFYSALEGYKFLPAGRITAGAGTQRDVTLYNCYVLGTIHDSMTGIFDALKDAALTLQQGGGIGHDFSTIRPKGAAVLGVGADASGPLSFMNVWDAMSRTIMSAGARRGAMMGTLRCDHPDIEAFIEAKRDPSKLRMFNVSVLVTDLFMKHVAYDWMWDLKFGDIVYKKVVARELWDAITRSAFDYAEPGVIFIDRVNALNNLSYCETISATNPCGEQPLPPYGACLLGSINLAAFVQRPFTPTAELDYGKLDEVVELAVRMLDNVVDVSRYPLKAQEDEAKSKRRIGLGITGLADALAMCGVHYGTPRGCAVAALWMSAITECAYNQSALLAFEKSPFPKFHDTLYIASPFIQKLPAYLQSRIANCGIRNSHLTSIAPTGTISLFAGNVSGGIEPIFEAGYNRTILEPDGSKRTQKVEDYAVHLYRQMHGPDAELPETFVTAHQLTPQQHLAMQAALQPHVDSAISKTVNCAADMPFDDFKDLYTQAYELGLKGCAAYRPNDITGSVLSLKSEPKATVPTEKPQPVPIINTTAASAPAAREPVLAGYTYKLKWPGSEHAIYVTINDVQEEFEHQDKQGVGLWWKRRPFEIFINSKNLEHYAWTVALTRMVSAVFRRGGDVSFVAEELKAVFDPKGGAWVDGKYVPSVVAAIGGVIHRHLQGCEAEPLVNDDAAASTSDTDPITYTRAQCAACGEASTVRTEGCDVCTGCGFSKCA